MKKTLLALLPLLGFLLSPPLAGTAQFTYTAVVGGYSVTGYTGSGGTVIIPDTVYGQRVVAIGDNVFWAQTSLTSVYIPSFVRSIGYQAFYHCSSLTSLAIPTGVASIGVGAFNGCTSLTNITIPGRVTGVASFAFEGCTSLIIVTIANGVTGIGNHAFGYCPRVTNITIPGSVTNVGDYAFEDCTGLQGVVFNGNAPSYGSNVFLGENATIYYLPGTTGWGATFADRPAVLWNPLMQSSGVGPAGFGFNITGTADIPIVIEAATSLDNASWVPLQSLNLTNGAFYFSDPNWTNYPARFYRIRSP